MLRIPRIPGGMPCPSCINCGAWVSRVIILFHFNPAVPYSGGMGCDAN